MASVVASGQLTLFDINDIITSATAPANPVEGTLWLDTSVSPALLRTYKSGSWEIVSDSSNQGNITKNSIFANWTSTYPVGFSSWSSTTASISTTLSTAITAVGQTSMVVASATNILIGTSLTIGSETKTVSAVNGTTITLSTALTKTYVVGATITGTNAFISKEINSTRNGGYGARFNCTTSGGQIGMNMTSSAYIPNVANIKYLFVEIDFMLASGSLDGAGLLVYWSGMTPYRTTLKLSDYVSNPTTNKWYTVRAVMQRPTDTVTGWTGMAGYIMANYSSIGDGVKDIIFDRVAIREATSEEINTSTWKMTGKTTIDGGQIETDTITAVQIKAGEVKTEHLQASIGITTPTVTGGTIRTASSGNRVQVTTSGLNCYNSSNALHGCTINRSDGAFVLYNNGTKVGDFNWDTSGAGTPEEAINRIFLRSLTGYALKLESGSDMSLGVPSGKNIYVSADAFRVAGDIYTSGNITNADSKSVYWNGSGSGTLSSSSALCAGGLVTLGANLYFGVSSEIKVTDMLGYNNGGTITYKPIRASSFPTSSSSKYKTNITEFEEDALQIVKDTKIYTYHLQSDIDALIFDKQRVGTITETANTLIRDEDGVDPYAMISILYKAVQQQQTLIEELKQQVADLQTII